MSLLLLIYPGCTAYELYAAAEILHANADVAVASTSLEPVVTGGVRLLPDVAFGEVDPGGFDVAAICGGDIAAVYDDEALAGLLRQLADADCVLGGICNGVWLMARAGVLDGARCTHTCHPSLAPPEILERAEPDFVRTEWIDEDVVVDGNRVTAKPWAYVSFATTLGRLAGLLEPGEAAALEQYYRGERPA